jgi:hypothetical protein
MIRKVLFVFALLLVPSAAMAQHHDHHAAKPAKADHGNIAKDMIALKADLNLTDDQIKKLEALSATMDEKHKMMAGMHANAAEAKKIEDKLHADLFAIFNEEQVVKVRALLKAHHDKMKTDKAAPAHKH